MDLHTHSTFSDGNKTPRQLLEMAEEKNLSLFSITDHDTIGGVLEVKENSKEYSFKFLTGIELSINYKNKKLEVLGYNFDVKRSFFGEKLKQLQLEREHRIHLILKKLNNIGINLKIADIESHTNLTESPGRLHIARTLVSKGYVSTVSEAFDKYIGNGKPAYVMRKAIEPIEAMKLIQNAGGIVVLPHPLVFESLNFENLREILDDFVIWGLKGIEIYYDYKTMLPGLSSEHINKGIEFLKRYCKKNDLLQTGGSDYHGDKGTLGTVKIPRNITAQLINYFST